MKRLSIFVIALVLISSVSTLLQGKPAQAVSGADWNPGRIIDDVVFQNKSSMTVAQIQQFLDSKVPVCDTWGTQPMWSGGPTRAQWSADNGKDLAPYTCLKDYRENPTTKENNASDPRINVPGGLSAAQLIYNASQAQNINPQVFMVLLQKEQSLITDDWPYARQFEKATGNNCPDTAPCNPAYAWFWTQVNNAGAQFNNYVANNQYYNYSTGWNNILYSPNASCGTKSVFIENIYTAALYIYTPYTPNQAALDNLYGTGDGCSAYGNRNFWRLFNDWFGGTLASSGECDSSVTDVVCVWGLKKGDGSQFLTTSRSEFTNAIYTYGWVNEGIAFYAAQIQKPNTIPVYRLRLNSVHYYTADQSDYDTKTGSEGWTDEGIAFYTYPESTSLNASRRLYRLFNSVEGIDYLTIDPGKRDNLLSQGYSLEPNPFNSLSSKAPLPVPAIGRHNVYYLKLDSRYLYTTNYFELEKAIALGYKYMGVLSTASSDNTGSPVYRLQSGLGYLYTTNINERNLAVQKYGMSDEGTVFYLDAISNTVYRLANRLTGVYYFTNSISELMNLSNTNGWTFEGPMHTMASDTRPVLRFLNRLNGKHFFTMNIYEAAKITNTNWEYEVIAFSANSITGRPVYRLLSYDKHFFTADPNERTIAVSNFGYKDEGTAFYVSDSITSAHVHRLQGRNDEYFYTTSSQERDLAVSKFGYTDEGIGFYLQP